MGLKKENMNFISLRKDGTRKIGFKYINSCPIYSTDSILPTTKGHDLRKWINNLSVIIKLDKLTELHNFVFVL